VKFVLNKKSRYAISKHYLKLHTGVLGIRNIRMTSVY